MRAAPRRILCLGGGPAGLYFALLAKKADPTRAVRVVERNRAYDTFGWGVVFSDQTLGNLEAADRETAREIVGAFNRWDDIDVHLRGTTIRSGGHGFCGIGRKRLLNILQARCEALGVELVFERQVEDDVAEARAFGADLVVASDGLNSRVRQKYAATFGPDVDTRRCRFVWLGTKKRFDAFTFAFEETPHGWFQAHAYQYDGDTSTFIVETPEETWKAAGLDAMTQEEGIAFCERLFAKYLDGHRSCRTRRTCAARRSGSSSRAWCASAGCTGSRTTSERSRATAPRAAPGRCNVQWPVVLMGDAAHTAHFSVGSGTKLALEDAIALEREIAAGPDLRAALDRYEAARGIEVLKIQNAARNSTEWFENVARYAPLDALQFAYSLLTRSQRISHENLRLRDAGLRASASSPGTRNRAGAGPDARPPMFAPFRLRDLELPNRVVVSPMAQYSCVDGMPDDYYLVHLGQPRARRRRARLHRDDLRVAGRAHLARLRRPVERRARRRRGSASSTTCTRARRRRSRCSSGMRVRRGRRRRAGRTPTSRSSSRPSTGR